MEKNRKVDSNYSNYFGNYLLKGFLLFKKKKLRQKYSQWRLQINTCSYVDTVALYTCAKIVLATASGRFGSCTWGQPVTHRCCNSSTIFIQTVDDIYSNCQERFFDVHVLLSGSFKKLYVVGFCKSFSFFERYNLRIILPLLINN